MITIDQHIQVMSGFVLAHTYYFLSLDCNKAPYIGSVCFFILLRYALISYLSLRVKILPIISPYNLRFVLGKKST